MSNTELLGKKLYEIRKGEGLSQEEFASKIGVSRQAVSKWERGEALPDTENLITISRTFSISLCSLILDTPENKLTEEGDCIETLESEIEVVETEEKPVKKSKFLRVLNNLPYPIIVTICYLLWGFLADNGFGWRVGWTLYLTIPVYYSIITCCKVKKLSPFAYPPFITFVYLFIGMAWGLWHPFWILFITVPVFYPIASAIDR